MTDITVDMFLAKTTKGTYVYNPESPEGAEVTSLYIQRTAYDKAAPDKITITITPRKK